MNFSRALAIVAVASAASAAEIPAGTHLLLRTEHSISSRTAKVGAGVHLRTSTPLSAGGQIVVPVGSYAQGVITDVKRGKLGIQLVTLTLPSGEVFNISPTTSSIEPENSVVAAQRRGAAKLRVSRGGGVLALTLTGGIVGGLEGARVGLAAGAAAVLIPAIVGSRKDLELREGTAVDVVFDRTAVLD
jgi:hypothetical protein